MLMVSLLWLVLALSRCEAGVVMSGRHTILTVSLPSRLNSAHNAVRLITKPVYNQDKPLASPGAVFFSTMYQGNPNTWSVKVTGGEEDGAEITLCFDPSRPLHTAEDYLSVVAYSELTADQLFTLQADWDTEFLLTDHSEPRDLNLTERSPQVVQLLPSPGSRNLLVVESLVNDEKCLYVGINHPGCPWRDSQASVTSSKLWSRMLKTGYFTIKSEDFPHSVTVSLILLQNSSDCFTERIVAREEENFKTVRISLKKLEIDYLKPFLISIFGVLLTSVIFFCVWVYCWYRQLHNNQKRLREDREGKRERQLALSNSGDCQAPDELKLLEIANTSVTPENIVRRNLCEHVERCHSSSQSLKSELTVADTCHLIREDCYHRRQRSKVYLYLVPLLALFYLIPSVQMVLAEQRRARDTGNMEMCFLNYGCSRHWGSFDDINHIVSNCGYILYGLAFILLVRLKAKFLPEENRTNTDHLGKIGLPQQHSIFYTLGVCMVMQGVFSAIFHTCPSNISLQFDTTMMYIMLILVFIKIYQFRHPDISFNAYNCMYGFVTILIMEAISLYVSAFSDKMIFYAIFAILYIGSAGYLLIDCYYYGALQTRFIRNVSVFIKESFTNSYIVYPKRFLMTMVLAVLNMFLLVLVLIRSVEDGAKGLSTPILIILASNVGVFLVHYMVRKIVENWTRPTNQPTGVHQTNQPPTRRWLMRFFSFLFFLLALILGLAAGYFYTHKHQSRNSYPPESRNMNELCQFMDFFDNHDMWHFLSATSLFLAFIFLLTIDDDLLLTDRTKIIVF